MKEQIVMSPKNGYCCVAIPLFRKHEFKTIENNLYSLTLATGEEKPDAYILDYGEGGQLVSADWAHEYLIFIGDL